MNLQDNIYKYRKEKGLSQEELGVLCHVSRQAVSKWENGTSKPDSDNLVLLSKYLEVSTDALLGLQTQTAVSNNEIQMPYHEVTYTSNIKIFNIPLVDVYFRVYHFHYYRHAYGGKAKVDMRSRSAKGIIAIGTKAIGVFTLSFFGIGLFGVGLFNIGLIASLGVFSASLMYAMGVIAISLYFAFGVVAIATYAFGVLAYGMQIAFGVAAFGKHTIGIVANGTYTYLLPEKTTCILLPEQYENLQLLLRDEHMPGIMRALLAHLPKC